MKEALKRALEALESSDKLINGTGNHFGLEGAMDGYYSGCFDVKGNNKLLNEAITAIKAALAQPTSGDYALGYAEGFNDACKPKPAQEPDHGDELTIAYMSGVHRGKELAAQPAPVQPVGIVETLGGYPDESRHEVKWLVPYRDLKDGDKLYRTPQAQPAQEPVALAQQEPDYAYPTIEGYEEITGFKVNDTFRMGWAMARTTNDLFKQMEKNT